ncbi:methionine synthase I [Stappia aggregata IAM 12614]|uniref:Methionine synthase I n=1 Tax=Roseibium aggregatum (strain ATCC 25650 / DSM 13394 / JCM 20685 / NBRC 16684 / NCIMB 2208 / IAM 12614 / B1) TaxID=384765 RepID=A0NU20_ROSAI|nr:methionine synthase I [Stappia aggregata IAM 12614] [Roseibium aggregatum IAM 12614]
MRFFLDGQMGRRLTSYAPKMSLVALSLSQEP